MASAAARARGNINPSAVLQPDTTHAAEQSDLPSSIHPTNSPPEKPQTNDRDQIASRPIRSRAETLASPSSKTSSSPVRRKPLPATASSLATRFSSGGHLVATLEQPEQTFTRPYSVDSPTLYEFPPTSKFPSALTGDPEQSLLKYIASSYPKHCFQWTALI